MTPFSRSKKTVTEEKSEIKIPEIKTSTLNDSVLTLKTVTEEKSEIKISDIKTSTLNDSVLTLKKNRYRGEIRNQDIRNQDADAQ